MSDLIDRQALLKQIDIDSDGEPGYYGDTWKFIDTIKNMPNVHDLPKDTDTISRQAAIDACGGYLVPANIIKQLPPIQPERIKGHWIDKPSGRYGQWQSWCSACGKRSGIGGAESNRHKPFCPNCGAEMREVAE